MHLCNKPSASKIVKTRAKTDIDTRFICGARGRRQNRLSSSAQPTDLLFASHMVRGRMTTFHPIWEVLLRRSFTSARLAGGEIDPPPLGVIVFPLPGNVHGASLKQSELI